jgi:hypothetical protein
VEPPDLTRVAALFSEERDVADRTAGGKLCVALGQAAFDELVGQLLEVKGQLSREFVVDGTWSNQCAPSLARDSQESPEHLRTLKE